MSLRNRLLTFFCQLFPIQKHPVEQDRRILIVTTTALGDTLWATPAIESLRKSFPNAFIGVLTSSMGREVLKDNAHIDQLYLLEEPLLPRFFSLRKKLYKERFDTILMFHASQRLTLPLCALLGATQIIGTRGINKGLDSLLTHPLEQLHEHEILRRLKIVENTGGSIHSETLSFTPDPEAFFPLEKKQWIILHPGSKDAFKRWKKEHFIMLGKELEKRWGYSLLITGTKEEQMLIETIAQEIPGARSLIPTSLDEFAHLLSQVEILISNDTGPVHLAAALKVPTIALYSPTNPQLCGPYLAKETIALYRKPTCTPCLKRKCPLPFCLSQITPKEVLEQVEKLMRSYVCT